MPYVTEDNLTEVALDRWKDIPDSCLRQIMQSLIRHLHYQVKYDFVLEKQTAALAAAE